MHKVSRVQLKVFLFFVFLFFIFTFKNKAEDMDVVKLPKPKLKSTTSLEEAIKSRRSVRSYSSKELTLNQISQLLWSCQGITGGMGLRAAPSAGALYPLEIYLATNQGVYKYLPMKHELKEISRENKKPELTRAAWGQNFISTVPVNIIICAVYERVTSRYGQRGVRYTDIEVGHAAQNIHLEAVSLGLDSVPVGAFDDKAVSDILGLPKNEKPIYIIPVGYRR